MDAGKGHLELMLLNSRAVESSQEEYLSRLKKQSVPIAVETEFKRLWEETRVCGGQLIHVGKVILNEIAGYVESHPYEHAGASIAAVVTAMLAGKAVRAGVFLRLSGRKFRHIYFPGYTGHSDKRHVGIRV